MKAVIMAGGFAKRLYPLTKNKSKCLIELAGKPVIDYTIDKLKEIKELNEIIVITNETFYKDFLNWAETHSFPIGVLSDGGTSENSKIGALGSFLNYLRKDNLEQDIFLSGADNFFKFSLRDIYQIFKKENKDLALFYDVKDIETAKRLGVALLERSLIVDFEEKPQKPKSTLTSSAMYFFKRETLPIIKKINEKEIKKDNLGVLIEYLYQKVPVYGAITEENIDIGTLELFRKAEKSLKKTKNTF